MGGLVTSAVYKALGTISELKDLVSDGENRLSYGEQIFNEGTRDRIKSTCGRFGIW